MTVTADRVYLVAALAFGAAMAFLTPPFQSPDEPDHFFRALCLARGQVLAAREGERLGGWLDAATIDWVHALTGDLPFHPEKKQAGGPRQ